MTVYRPRQNPLLMTVMGANPSGPAFIVIDSVTGRVMYTKRATGMGNEALNSCALAAHKFARATGRSQIVFLDLSRARVGDTRNVAGVRVMGISEEIHPDGSVTRNNPVRRRRSPDDAIDTAIGEAWPRLMHGVQVPIMDIPRIFRDIKLEMAGGATLEQAVLAVGSRYRVNRNPKARQHRGGDRVSAFVTVDSADGSVVFRKAFRPGDPSASAEADRRARGGQIVHSRPFYSFWDLTGQLKVGDKVSADKIEHLRQSRESWRQVGMNRNPGLGAAVIGGIAGAVANRVLKNPGFRRNMPVASVWDRLTDRQRQWALGFAGVSENQIDYYVPRSWRTLPPKIQSAITAGWRENPSHDRRGPIAREYGTVCRKCGGHHPTITCEPARCTMCGEDRGSKGPFRVPKVGPSKGKLICDQCYRGWRSGRRSGETWAKNPGRTSRKTTMPIAKFAQLVKNQRDPALWRDFVAKCKAYHSWSHGAWPTKVTVERVNKPGMKGLWIAFDMGKQPESTYIMPKGSKRKGAWKHPWTRMPQMRGDPQAGMIITKLGGGNRLTNFLHG